MFACLYSLPPSLPPSLPHLKTKGNPGLHAIHKVLIVIFPPDGQPISNPLSSLPPSLPSSLPPSPQHQGQPGPVRHTQILDRDLPFRRPASGGAFIFYHGRGFGGHFAVFLDAFHGWGEGGREGGRGGREGGEVENIKNGGWVCPRPWQGPRRGLRCIPGCVPRLRRGREGGRGGRLRIGRMGGGLSSIMAGASEGTSLYSWICSKAEAREGGRKG